MKPNAHCLPMIRARFQSYFPRHVRQQITARASLGDYPRRIDPFALMGVLLSAYLSLASGLRDILERWAGALGTHSLGSLSYALGRTFNLDCLLAALDHLAGSPPRRGDLVVIDSMAVSIPKTRRHNCRKMNNNTVGGGVLWQMCLTASRQASPVRILELIDGAWNDSARIRSAALIARGPRYIMDRGFYAIDNLAAWLDRGVRFVLRARGKDLVYEPVRTLGQPRPLRAKPTSRRQRAVRALFDGVARIGSEKRRGPRPVVRLLLCEMTTAKGKTEDLVVMSENLAIDAQQLLDLYGRRWEVEEFHRLLKRAVGLAHLYSFRQQGLKLLTAAALLLTVLLWLDDTAPEPLRKRSKHRIVKLLRKTLEAQRRPLGIRHIWRPNTVSKQSWRHRH